MNILTQENIFVMLFACAVLVFYATRAFINTFLECQIERLKAGNLDGGEAYKLYRYVSAHFALSFLHTMAVVATTLGLALGVYKAFADLVQLVLPDRAISFMLLVSYCGLHPIYGVVKDDIHSAMKKFLQ